MLVLAVNGPARLSSEGYYARFLFKAFNHTTTHAVRQNGSSFVLDQ